MKDSYCADIYGYTNMWQDICSDMKEQKCRQMVVNSR